MFSPSKIVKLFLVLYIFPTFLYAMHELEDASDSALVAKITAIPMCQTDLDPLETNTLRSLFPTQLMEKIDTYHSTPKTDATKLDNRIEQLYQICEACNLLSESRTDRKKALDELFSTAAAKYNYLRELSRSYAIFRGKNSFGTFLRKFFVFNHDSCLVSRHMPDLALIRQALDPYQSDAPEIHQLFQKWEQAASVEKTPPFLLWLEQYTRPDKPSKIISSSQELDQLKLTFKDGMIYQNNTPLTLERADYVVDHKGDFYLSKDIKHAGFFKGEAIAAAGEITVIKGKVTYIDDNSGHYQIRIKHLLQAIQRLSQQGVFEKNAVVSFLDTRKFIELGSERINAQPSLGLTKILVEQFLKEPPYEPDGFIVLYYYNIKKFELRKLK